MIFVVNNFPAKVMQLGTLLFMKWRSQVIKYLYKKLKSVFKGCCIRKNSNLLLKVKEFCLDSFTNLAFFVMFWNKSELSGWPSQPYFLSSKEVKQFHSKQKEPCICTGLHWFPIWRLCRIYYILIGDFRFAVQMWDYF